MSEAPRPYSALSPAEQEALSVWIDRFDQGYECEGDAALKRALRESPRELRLALLSQLLPAVIEQDRRRLGTIPTLHELRLRHPDLAGDLAAVYPLLPASYRLPVELHGYRVLRVVAEGGQAVVLRAQDDVHSAVAIKLSAAPQHNELLLRERRLLGECQHPGVPVVIASGLCEERAYFIMPFLRGTTLADKFASHRPPLVEAARIAADLCQIVAHLHAQGILHRDVKPSNVWIDEQGSVKLIDLGMAIERQSWGAPLPAVQEFHGTPAFMSPEQANADATLDGELSDVFSIGATLYWMLAGVPPFGGGDNRHALAQAQNCVIDWAQLAGTPRRLRILCRQALASRPSNRYPSATALGEALRRWAERTKRGTAWRWAAVTAIVVLVGAGLALGSSLLHFPLDAPPSPPAATPIADATAEPPVNIAASSPPIADVQDETVEEALPPEPTLAPPHDESDPRSKSLVQQSEAQPLEQAEQEEPIVEVNWIRDKASASHIELEGIASDVFGVSASSALRYAKPWGKEDFTPARPGRLEVRYTPHLEAIASALEFRTGEGPWRSLSVSRRRHAAYAELASADVEAGGDVQIRLGGLSAATCAGPFTYPVSCAEQMAADEEKFRDELVDQAMSAAIFLEKTENWQLADDFIERFGPVIREVRIASQITDSMRAIQRPQNGDSLQECVRDKFDLRRLFDRVVTELRIRDVMWIEIDFSNGRFLGAQRFRRTTPAGHQASLQGRSRLAARSPRTPIGRLSGFDLNLAGFAEIHQSLDSIEIGSASDDFSMLAPVIDEPDQTSLQRLLSVSPPTQTTAANPSGIIPYRVPAAYFFGGRQLTPINVPPVWEAAYVRGRFKDGSHTNVYRIPNEARQEGFALQPLRGSATPACAFFQFSNSEINPQARPYPRLPPDEVALLKRAKLHCFLVLPQGTAYFLDADVVNGFSSSDKLPLYIDVFFPVLDRYGRQVAAPEFRMSSAKFFRIFDRWRNTQSH